MLFPKGARYRGVHCKLLKNRPISEKSPRLLAINILEIEFEISG